MSKQGRKEANGIQVSENNDLSNKSILSLIENILKITKNKELSDESIKECEPYSSALGVRLGITPMQSIFLSVFLDNCNDRKILYSDIGSHFDCSNIKIMTFNDDLNALAGVGYIEKYSSKKETHFRIPSQVVVSFIENQVYVKPETTGLDVFQLFEHLDSCFEKCVDGDICTDELNHRVHSLLGDNPNLHFVQSLNKYMPYAIYDRTYTPLLMVYMCHLLVNNDDDDVGCHDYEKIIDQKNIYNMISKQMRGESHDLIVNDLIEHKKTEGLFSRDVFRLTKRIKTEVLSDFDIDIDEKEVNVKNLLKHEDISSKQLFYNADEEKQIAQLSTLLEEKQFKSIQSRLSDNGMRKGFAALFYGSPGTGKTETALQIARQTGRDIIEVNVSQIKSMWVGESEKNIKATFDNYRKVSKKVDIAPILLFNEADAILGNRMENTLHAVDKMENSIQNIILQEMETLDGIMIATTNLTKNLDSAFERRFLYKIEFSKPSLEAKQAIWQSMLCTLSDDEARVLGEKYEFSGGQIENIVRKCTVDNIISGVEPSFADIEGYCKQENIDKSASRKRIGF